MSGAAAPAKKLTPYYQSENVTLYNTRFEYVLPTIEQYSIDLLLTDPPYAITGLKWDKVIDWKFLWSEAHRLCKPNAPIVFFASGKFVNELINTNPKHYRYELIWEKNLAVGFLNANSRPLRAHENILFFSQLFKGSTYNPQWVEGKVHHRAKKASTTKIYGEPKEYVGKNIETNLYHPRSVLRFNNRDGKIWHPTQKPLGLMQWLVRAYSNRNDLILEPFAGSGSTLVAALNNGRKAIGVEQSEEYCEIIAKRLELGE